VAAVGATATVTGGSNVTVAVADLVVSAALVALMVTDCCAATLAGAVYSPLLLTVPAPVVGLIVHVTAVLPVPVTVAVNCCVPPPYTVAVVGAIVTLTAVGDSVTVAVADLVVSAALVALMVTVCCVVTLAGAV
jgi:hypothetical protein